MERDYLRPCAAGKDFCAQSLRVDWLSDGSQVLEFERYCTDKPIVNNCVEGGELSSIQLIVN